MSTSYKITFSLIGLLALALCAYSFGLTDTVKGAFSGFNEDCRTATATSSLTAQTPGTATTTVTCNLALGGSGGGAAKSAVVAVQVNASSSNSTWRFYAEESMNNVDYYPVVLDEWNNGSTSPRIDVISEALGNTYWYYKFASTTVGGAGAGQTTLFGTTGSWNRDHFTFNVPTRMRYLRVYSTMASSTTGSNGGDFGRVWMQIIPQVEQ